MTTETTTVAAETVTTVTETAAAPVAVPPVPFRRAVINQRSGGPLLTLRYNDGRPPVLVYCGDIDATESAILAIGRVAGKAAPGGVAEALEAMGLDGEDPAYPLIARLREAAGE